mgnify:FL=1
MATTKAVSATEFKATCLDLLGRVNAGEWDRVEVTKRGKVVAVVVKPPATAAEAKGLHGALRGRVIIPEGFDLTAPTPDELMDAELGILHRVATCCSTPARRSGWDRARGWPDPRSPPSRPRRPTAMC